MEHQRMNTYKLIYCAHVFADGTRVFVTEHEDLTYEMALAIQKTNRKLTIVQEWKGDK